MYIGILYHSRIARTAAVLSGQEIKPLLDSESRYIRQIVAQDNSTSRTIMWQSDSSEADAVIEYRLAGSENTQTIGATDKVLLMTAVLPIFMRLH